LFDDNQCLLDLVHRRGKGATVAAGAQLPAIAILTLDDLGFADNQCECYLGQATMAVATVLVGLISLRAADNRFSETLGKAQFSALTLALMNMTVNNQANHCLRIIGLLRQQAVPNHVLVTAFQSEYCRVADRNLVSMVRSIS
jgi:hypothetical protein